MNKIYKNEALSIYLSTPVRAFSKVFTKTVEKMKDNMTVE